MKPTMIAAVLWLLAMVALFVFMAPLADALMLLTVLVLGPLLVVGGVIAMVGLLTVRRDWRHAVAVLAICGTGFLLYSSNMGFVWGRHVLFQLRKPDYVRQLAAAEALGEVPEGQGSTDPGPPVVHGFYWQRGMLDNWSAVVYDPTGRIAAINDAEDWNAIHRSGLSDLFGGTYYRCQSMGGGWYICWFT